MNRIKQHRYSIGFMVAFLSLLLMALTGCSSPKPFYDNVEGKGLTNYEVGILVDSIYTKYDK